VVAIAIAYSRFNGGYGRGEIAGFLGRGCREESDRILFKAK